MERPPPPPSCVAQISQMASASTSRGQRILGRSRFEATFFDARVFNPYAACYRLSPLQRIFDTHDRQKRRLYKERIREVEGASFTPWVFSSTGTTGRTSEAFLKRLASPPVGKEEHLLLGDHRVVTVSGKLRLLRANIICLRGTRARVDRWNHTATMLPCPRASAGQYGGNKRLSMIHRNYMETRPQTFYQPFYTMIVLYIIITHVLSHIKFCCYVFEFLVVFVMFFSPFFYSFVTLRWLLCISFFVLCFVMRMMMTDLMITSFFTLCCIFI